jgi:hypothetical protein
MSPGSRWFLFRGISAIKPRCKPAFPVRGERRLQDPPELLGRGLVKLSEGYDVVYAVRKKRKESFVKRGMYALYYRLLSSIAEVNIPLDAGIFA